MNVQRARLSMGRHQYLLVAGVLSLVGLVIGCEKADWEDPAYISEKLVEGNVTEQRMALEKYRELSEELRVEVVPALAQAYLSGDTSLQRESMSRLVQLRNANAKEAYMQEIKSNATGYAGAAAEALGIAQVNEAIPEMLNVLTSTDSNDIKLAILQGFSHMPDRRQVAALVDILKLDADNNPIALHSYSCDILGNVAQDHADAFDENAIRTLVRATYLANNVGQNVGRECGLAVQQLGETAVPVLLETFRGENDDVKSLLMLYNRPPQYAFPENHARLGAAIRLTALRTADAVAPFVADLRSDKAAPDGLAGQHAVAWRLKEGQFTDEVINGLGDLGDSSARQVLEQVMLGQRNKAWDDITDGLIELQLRQNAALALNRLGDRSALPAMLRAARDGVIIDLERRFAMLAQRGHAAPIVERYQFNWMVAQAYANLATSEHEKEFKRLISATKEKELKEKYESFLPMFELAAKCEAKDGAKDQALCYAEALDDKNELLREKAAFELTRFPAEVAAGVLVDKLATEYLETREILTLGLYRAPSKEAVAKIDAILTQEANKTGQEYRLDHYRLRLAKAWMKNHLARQVASN